MTPDIKLPINIDLKGAFGRKREINVLRLESDKFKICEPTVVRSQKHLASEATWIVHVPKKGRIRARLLKT